MGQALHHNRWYEGKITSGTGDDAVTSHKFEHMFALIQHGERIGDEIFVERLSLRLFLPSQAGAGSCITYRLIVYFTANQVPGSSGYPMLLKDGIDGLAVSQFPYLLYNPVINVRTGFI